MATTKRKKKTNMVTRRVIESSTYKLVGFMDGKMVELDTVTLSGRLNEKELAEKYKCPSLKAVKIEEHKAVYGVPVDDFMKIAVKLEDSEENAE